MTGFSIPTKTRGRYSNHCFVPDFIQCRQQILDLDALSLVEPISPALHNIVCAALRQLLPNFDSILRKCQQLLLVRVIRLHLVIILESIATRLGRIAKKHGRVAIQKSMLVHRFLKHSMRSFFGT